MSEFVSMAPSDFEEGSQFLDNVDVSLTAVFGEFEYNNRPDLEPVPALIVTMKDPDGNEYEQSYTCGDRNNFKATEDGQRLEKIGTATSLHKSCNAAKFLAAMVNARFPEDKLSEEPISIINGTSCRVSQHAAPTQSKKDNTILLVDQIYKLPWEKKAQKKGAAKGKTESKAPESENGGSDTEATKMILKVLAEAGEAISKKDMVTSVYQEMNAGGNVDVDLITKIATPEFLNAGPWNYSQDEETIGLG